MKFIYKHYYIFLVILFLIFLKCLFIFIKFKPYPHFKTPLQDTKIYGMRSNDKLNTYKLLWNNIGMNKVFSYTGFETQSITNSLYALPINNSSCIDILDDKNNVLTFSLRSQTSEQVYKNFTLYNLRFFRDLENLKRAFKRDFESIINFNSSQDNNKNDILIEVCALGDAMSQYLFLVEKDPEKYIHSRLEMRRCFVHSDECKLDFFKKYWSSNDQIINLSVKGFKINQIYYENKNTIIQKPILFDSLIENKNFSNEFYNLVKKYYVNSIDFKNNLKLKYEYIKSMIISNIFVLIWSLIIVTILSIIFFGTFLILIASIITYSISIFFSYICYYLIGSYYQVHDKPNDLSTFNLISASTLYFLVLHDSFIVSVSYDQSRKLATNTKVIIRNRSIRIVKNTFKQSFYYIIPKNLAFIFILFVSYLNQIELIQKFSLFLSILILNYLFLGFLTSAFVILLLSNYHHRFWYKHQIKIFEIDLNKSIKNFFSSHFPFIINKIKIFLVIFFGIASLISLIIIFLYPKFNLDPNIIGNGFNKKENFKFLIVWGAKINQLGENYNTIESLLNIDMETQAFQEFKTMSKFCNNLKELNFNKFQILNSNCFSNNLAKYLNKKSKNVKNVQELDLLVHVEETLEKPFFKMHENNCQLKAYNEDLIKNLYAQCIKWWSLNVLAYQLRENLTFETSPVYLSNRLLPSLFLIEIQTNLSLADSKFNTIQTFLNSVETWWKQVIKKFNINENHVWWTSPQLENYFFQKKLNQQILLTTLISLIILFALTIYSCSKFITSFCVFLNIISAMSTISSILVLIGYKINNYEIILFIIQIFLSTQYSLLLGVSLRFCPHIDIENSLKWAFSIFGGSVTSFFLIITLGSLPLVIVSVDFYFKFGTVLLISNLVSFLYSMFFLPSLMYLSSGDMFQNFGERFRSNRTNISRMGRMGRQVSTSSFAPSIVYSHAHTISTFFEADFNDIGEYRRRTLSRCNSEFNSQKNSIIAFYSNSSNSTRNSISNQNPNFLQIPRYSRASVRRISNQSRRSSYLISRRCSSSLSRRSSKRVVLEVDNRLNSDSRPSTHLTVPNEVIQITVEDK